MVLIIIAIVNLLGNTAVSTMKTLLDVGSAISSVSWLLLAVWALQSLHAAPRAAMNEDAETFTRGRTVRNIPSSVSNTRFRGSPFSSANVLGSQLLYAVLGALPLVAIRLAYAIAYLQLRISHPSSAFLTSTAATVCLSLIPEMLCILVLLLAGLRTVELRPRLKFRDAGTSATPLMSRKSGQC